MKKVTLLSFLALSVLALSLGACKSKETVAPAPPAPAGYIDSGK